MFDYETLRLIWWGILVFLSCGFAVMGGFDLGIGMLLPFLGKTDAERRVILNTIGPTWEGNQTWLITLGGISFAAWPLVYATLFSGLYAAILMLLFGLFLRPVGFDYRSKLTDPRWRCVWDWALFAGGALPSFVLSLVAGNLMLGLPFQFDADLRVTADSRFGGLCSPFALLSAVVGIALLCMHGAVFLQWRTEADLAERTRRSIFWSGGLFSVGFILAGLWIDLGVDGYRIISVIDTHQYANPLLKTVEKLPGLWLNNYQQYPWLSLAPVLAILCTWLVILCTWLVILLSAKRLLGLAFLMSCLVVISVIVTTAGAMFPFILPSSIAPSSSLTVWDASASNYSLQTLLIATVLLMPVVMAYTIWAYRVLRGKVTLGDINKNPHVLY